MRPFTRSVGLALLLALASVRAWVPQEADVWPDGVVPIALELAATAPNNNVPWVSAADEAMATWNGLLQRVQLVSTPLSGQPWYDNGRNELFFDEKIYGEPFPNGVLAFTIVTTDRDARVEADIVFNPGQRWSLYHGAWQSTAADFRRVAVHELGHLLGLDHPDESGQKISAIMNSTAGDVETPTADDQAGVHALYDRGSRSAPVILGGPTVNEPEVTAGTWVKFGVLAGGRGPFSYTWRRDGVALPNGTGAILRLDPVRLSDSGNYTVVVSNGIAATTSSRSAQLKVNPAQPPRIVEVFGRWEVTATAGTDYTFDAQGLLTGDYPVSFEWKRNGLLVGSTQYPNFTLKDLQFSDSGDYTVTATNIAGSATTRAVHLTVTPGAPPQFLADYAPMSFAIGSTATISTGSEVTGSGPLTYQWSKDGVAITTTAAGSTTTIPSFQASDAGVYTVTVSNSFGRATSPPIVVTVASGAVRPPLITSQPTAVTEYAGANVRFNVQLEQDGRYVSFRWLKDGVPLPLPPPVPGFPPPTVGPIFAINSIREQDAGVYSVEVSNSVGTVVSRGAKLTVLPDVKPVITLQPSAQTVAVGDFIRLSVAARSPFRSQTQPPLDYECTYQLFKDGTPVTVSGPIQATLADAGRYFWRVTSPTGLTTDSDTVVVAVTTGALPIITTQPGNRLLDASDTEYLRLTTVELTVLARRAAPGADATSQLIAAAGPPIGGVTPGTYVVRATKDGVTETSKPFTIGFLSAVTPVILSHPQGRTVNLGDNFDLFASATAYAPMTYQWSKDGVVLPGATNYNYAFRGFTAAQIGSYRVTVTSAAGSTVSEPAVVEARALEAPIISSQPTSKTIMVGSPLNLSVSATGGPLRYQWLKNGQPIAGSTRAGVFVESAVAETAGGYSVIVSNDVASVTSRTAQIRVLAPQRPPEIVFQPESQAVPAGGDVTLVVGADGGPLPDRYQWRKDGVDIPGANDAELRLHGVQMTDAGAYTVVAYNSFGSATSAAAVLSIDAAGRLVNIATRASAGRGADVLIAGFVIAGTQPRAVLVRGVGDQLSEFGVAGVLRNPYLQLFDAKAKLVASSDNWFDGSDSAANRNARVAAIQAAEKEVGAFPLRTDTRDAALIATLAPGSYTTQVSGMVNTAGVALVEVYELGKPSNTRLANLSSRCYVGAGAQILIPGVVIGGHGPRRLLIRAIGPGLAAFNVEKALIDPVLVVFRGSERIAQNDNWGDSPDAAQMAQAAATVAAFPLASGSKDAALLLDLAPGAYTVQVAGAGGATGVALVEVYEITK